MNSLSIRRFTLLKPIGLLLIAAFVLGPALDADARRRRRRRRGRQAKPSVVEIMSMTKGASVFVDDKKVGEVPLSAPVQLSPGAPHVVRLQKRGFAPFVETVRLKPGENRELEADLVPSGGILKIICNIRRAQVLLDGRPIGRTPFDGDVMAGKHKLEVIAPGKRPESRVVELFAGRVTHIAVELKDPLPAVVKKDESVLGRWWFWTAVGAAVLGGATAAALATRDVEVAPPQANLTLNLGRN